jgi:hypothetical protein
MNNLDENLHDLDSEDMYHKMLDALLEYLASMDHEDFTKRDITILQALVEFYGFDQELLIDFLNQATELLEKEEESLSH